MIYNQDIYLQLKCCKTIIITYIKTYNCEQENNYHYKEKMFETT